jgi:D-alanyl-D-alanine carboxypeptidase/D-alanyl-D-alanine-endopeptidase (penicillin-binding protein 4)
VRLPRKIRVVVVVLAALVPVLTVPSALAGSAVVTISASTPIVDLDGGVTLAGSVSGDPGCAAGRSVLLQWRAADSAGFATVGEDTTDADGAFAFVQSQAHTGRYRASLPAVAGCDQAVSDEVAVRVRGFVDGSIVAGSSEAGSCIDLFAVVTPPKPGQDVEIQRRVDGRWRTVETVPLNGESQARAHPCLAWEEIGIARFRVRWAAQDRLNETATSHILALEVTRAAWMERIDDAVDGRAISVSVAEEGAFLYRRADGVRRIPASNTKLLLAMAALDTFGPDHRIATRAAARTVEGGVVAGDLWLLGRGDPLLRRATLGTLAQEIAAAGVTRVRGSVMGSTGYFLHDWNAPGWNDVARDYVNLPTALTFEGNDDRDPERHAAAALTKQLEGLGVAVRGRPGAGAPPNGLEDLATIDSKPMRILLTKVLRPSWNFGAEVIGKGLGASVRGTPGTIAKGAATIEAWIRGHGPSFELHDNSGLSYANRVTAAGIVDLLGDAEDATWGDDLRRALPTGGQGTLRERLNHVEVRAKTGTLTDVSTLSGWVFSERRDAWLEFSILCAGLSKSVAADIEDRIVRILHERAG